MSMDDITTLAGWAEAYVKHRDLFERKIASIEKADGGFLVKNKDGSALQCVVADALDEAVLRRLAKDRLLVVTRNRKANLDFLVGHWTEFSKHAALKIVFANLQHNEKWVLVPSSHAAVADPESLALGLEALFQAVPEG